MFHGVVGTEALPHNNVEATRKAGSDESGGNSSIRTRATTESSNCRYGMDEYGVDAWWTAVDDIPGFVLKPGKQGPQGVAESSNRQPTAFIHVPSYAIRELHAAAPFLTPTRLDVPSGPLLSMATSGLLPSKTAGRVLFVNGSGRVPGEVPSTPTARSAAAYNDTLGPSFGAFSGFSTIPMPTSPERRAQLGTEAAFRNVQTSIQTLNTTIRQTPVSHLAPLERPQDVAQLRLQITLQHSTTIEKVSAAELIPFGVGEAPFVNGQDPDPAVVRAIYGAHELRRAAFYVPSDLTDAAASGNREVVSGVLSHNPRDAQVLVQLFVLFPSLMRPPHWLRKDFSMVKRASVEVDWQLSRRTEFLLYCLRRLDHAKAQGMTVWASKRRFGVGEAFTLYGAEGRSELTDRSYILVLKFYERREGPGPKSVLIASREGPMRRQGTSAMGAAPSGAACGGEIDASVSVDRPGITGTGCDTLEGGGDGCVSFASKVTVQKACTRMDMLHKVQQQLLLRAQSSSIEGSLPIPESGLITWDGVLDYTLAARDGVALRRLIDSHYVDHLLKSQQIVDRVEKVAISNHDPVLMMMLYEHTSIEMDLRVLAFLVHCWAVQPLSGRSGAAAAAIANMAPFDNAQEELPDFFDGGDDMGGNLAAKIEEFLVKYVLHRRNPLSSTAAILRAIDDEMAQHEENRRIMRLASSRFHSLHLAMLRRLNRYADVHNIRFVERILQPVEMPNTVNEVSPLQVAFDSRDLKFMTETLIELYVKVQWLGRELLALTQHEDPRALGATNPLLAYAVLKSMGFAGKGTMDFLAMAASRLWHLYVFTSTAFFDSPRGRWAMHVLFELAFLGLYQWQVMYPDWDVGNLQVLHLVFMSFIIGNLLDIAQFVHYRYGSLAHIRRFLTDPWNALGLVVNGGLMVLTCLKLAQDFRAPGFSPYESADTIHVCMATLAVFVWVRALGMAVPVYPSLGPLLNTVARMMEEVIAFLFPMLIVMTGFSTMMAAIYQDLTDEYNSFQQAMLQLFSSMLGNFDFTAFNKLTMVQQLYGIIVLVIFLVISAILLMNLLIAIITNRYRPQEVEAESQFKKAQIVSYYQTQVTRNLVCSPFCIPQLLLQAVPLLPSGRRNKLSGAARSVRVLGLVPLDGVVLPDDGSDRPTGASEIPHLVFLLTLYPIMAVTCMLLFALYAPFGVLQFARKMYIRLAKKCNKRMEERRPRDREKSKAVNDKECSKAPQATSNNAEKKKEDKQVSSSLPPPLTGADLESGQVAKLTTAGVGETGGGQGRATTANGAGQGANAKNDASKQYQRLKKELQAQSHSANMGIMHTMGYIAASSVLTAVGLVLYMAVLMVLMLVGWASLYQWLAKIAFSLYNILLRPFVDMVRFQRRQKRIRPAPPRKAASAAAALQVASGVGMEPATAGGGQGAVPMNGWGSGVGRTGGGPLSALFGGGGRKESSVPTSKDTSRKDGSATSDGGGGISNTGGALIGAPAVPANGSDESEQLLHYKQSKARVHWRHAILKVIALKNERYLTKTDVLKALASSKFRPHMAGWNLRVDLRSSSQDIMESQMQDLEDDDDRWDDDELQAGGDDDTLEAAILEKTENLASMLKLGMNRQQSTIVTLIDRVQQLAEEVSALRRQQRITDDVVGDDDDLQPTPARPLPPPTRPPSRWGLAAEAWSQAEDPSEADSVLMASAIRREPELPQLSARISTGGSNGTKPRISDSGDTRTGCGVESRSGTGGKGNKTTGTAPDRGGPKDSDANPAAAAAPAAAALNPEGEPTSRPPLPPPPPLPLSRSKSPGTGPSRSKTATPRRSRPASSPTAVTPSAAVQDSMEATLPTLSRAFEEHGSEAPPSHAMAGLSAATTVSTSLPRHLKPIANASRTISAPHESSEGGGSQPTSTQGSGRRPSSAGSGPRALHQQMTLERLLYSSGGQDTLLAAIGTKHERHRPGGFGIAAMSTSAVKPNLKPSIRPDRHDQAPSTGRIAIPSAGPTGASAAGPGPELALAAGMAPPSGAAVAKRTQDAGLTTAPASEPASVEGPFGGSTTLGNVDEDVPPPPRR